MGAYIKVHRVKGLGGLRCAPVTFNDPSCGENF